MKLQVKLTELRAERKAILAANFYNLETLQAIIGGATDAGATHAGATHAGATHAGATHAGVPVILQLSESSINYIGLDMAVQMAKTALRVSGVEGWLHLDHGSSLSLVQRCLDAGFDSVMIDASEKSMEENIRISREAVKLAEPYGANVEAELGYIAKLNQAQDQSGFTQPEDARRFTEETGVHALAVSIGTAHGFYKKEPRLDIALLGRIREAVDTPLVLHGSSGISDAALVEAIRNGITKINLATETKNAFMRKLKTDLLETDEIDLRIVFPRATETARKLIRNKLNAIAQ